MTIWQQELSDSIHLVGVSGRLDQTQTPDLEEQFDELLKAGHYRIVVDMSDVTYINSGGLRCLVTAWRRAKKQGGNVVLTGLKERVNEVFSMVGFDKVFDVYPTQAAAEAAWHGEG